MKILLILLLLTTCIHSGVRRKAKNKKKVDPLMINTDEDYLRRKKNVRPTVNEQVCNAEEHVDYAELPSDKRNIVTMPSGLRYKVVKQGEMFRPGADSAIDGRFTGRLIKKISALFKKKGKGKQKGKIVQPDGGQKISIEQPIDGGAMALDLLQEIGNHLGFVMVDIHRDVKRDFDKLYYSLRDKSLWKFYIPEDKFLGKKGYRDQHPNTDMIFEIYVKSIMDNPVKIEDEVDVLEGLDKDEL